MGNVLARLLLTRRNGYLTVYIVVYNENHGPTEFMLVLWDLLIKLALKNLLILC